MGIASGYGGYLGCRELKAAVFAPLRMRGLGFGDRGWGEIRCWIGGWSVWEVVEYGFWGGGGGGGVVGVFGGA